MKQLFKKFANLFSKVKASLEDIDYDYDDNADVEYKEVKIVYKVKVPVETIDDDIDSVYDAIEELMTFSFGDYDSEILETTISCDEFTKVITNEIPQESATTENIISFPSDHVV